MVEDRLGSVFGIVIGRLFEQFYNEELWRQPQPQGTLVSRIDSTIQAVLLEQTTAQRWSSAGVLRWKGTGEGFNPKGLYTNEGELANHVREVLAYGFQTIREHRLLGPYAKAEIKLDHVFDYQGHSCKLAGRADFIIQRMRPHSDLVIVDGKGSRWGSLNTDLNQLWWYAMLYRARHAKLPDKVGFLYWVFSRISWFIPEEAVIDQLQSSVLEDVFAVWKDTPRGVAGFSATPSKENCKFCSYATEQLCPAGFQETSCHR